MTKAPSWALSFNMNHRCEKGAEWPLFFFCCLDMPDMSYLNKVDVVLGNAGCFGLLQPFQAIIALIIRHYWQGIYQLYVDFFHTELPTHM